MASITKRRGRKLCLKCGQTLSYSAYHMYKHQNPLICPSKSSIETPQSLQFELSESQLPKYSEDIPEVPYELHNVETDEEMERDYSSKSSYSTEAMDSDDDVEIVSEEYTNDLDENTLPLLPSQSQTGKSDVTLLQLCYHISDRAINLLLSFLRGLLAWINTPISNRDVNETV